MEELDLKELFNIFWRRKVAIIVILFIAIVIGVLYSYLGIKPKYTSYTTALLKQQNTYLTIGEKTNESNLISYVPTYIELVKSKTVINEVIETLDLSVGNIEVLQIEDTEIVKISVTHSNPEHAAKVASKLVEVTNKKIKEIYDIEEIYIIDNAEVSQTPSNINHKRDIIIFTFIGIVVACAYVLLMNIIKPNT